VSGRISAGATQFTCFTGTKVQILTQKMPCSPRVRMFQEMEANGFEVHLLTHTGEQVEKKKRKKILKKQTQKILFLYTQEARRKSASTSAWRLT
jgi:hypothetical protein